MRLYSDQPGCAKSDAGSLLLLQNRPTNTYTGHTLRSGVARLLLLLGLVAPAMGQDYSWRDTLDAIRQVETGGCPNEGIGAKGDKGSAIGPYQIWRIYHTDAAERDKTLTDYSRCLTSKDYSERVVRAYAHRYSRAALLRLEAGTGTLADVELIARRHNGGPRGDRKREKTEGYWRKVREALRG